MTSPGSDRACYKAIRQVVQAAMTERVLSEADVRDLIAHEHATNWPDAALDEADLAGTCLYWQHAARKENEPPSSGQKPDYKEMIAAAGLLSQGRDLTRKVLTERGVDLPVAFVKWLAQKGHWRHQHVVKDVNGDEWPLFYGRWLDPCDITEMKAEDLEKLRAEFGVAQREKTRVAAKRRANRPTQGRVVHGIYRRTVPGNRAAHIECEFDWGVAASDDTIYLPSGRRKDATGRQIQWFALLQNGLPVIEAIPTRPKGELAPDSLRTENQHWR